MSKDDTSVARMFETYHDGVWRFAFGDTSADESESDYLARFKSDTTQVVGAEFDVLDELFADADDYVSDPTLRAATGGISGDELSSRARNAYIRLFGPPT